MIVIIAYNSKRTINLLKSQSVLYKTVHQRESNVKILLVQYLKVKLSQDAFKLSCIESTIRSKE